MVKPIRATVMIVSVVADEDEARGAATGIARRQDDEVARDGNCVTHGFLISDWYSARMTRVGPRAGLRSALTCAIVAVSLLALPVPSTRDATARSGVLQEVPPRALPAALRALGVEPDLFVSAVAADIDADGDLDLVASDSSLQLHVWVNDGRGHFTAQRPVQSTSWNGEPPGPSVDARPIRSESWTQNDPPTVRDVAPVLYATGGSAKTFSPRRTRTDPADRSTRTPRAPPASHRLT